MGRTAATFKRATVHLGVSGHATLLKNYVFGFKSRSRSFDVLEWRGQTSAVDGWEWPDETGVVTFRKVPIDPKGMFFVSAFSTATYSTPQPVVVWGNALPQFETPAGFLFDVRPAGTTHTVTRSLSNTDTFLSETRSRARGGSGELSLGLGPVTGKLGGSGTNTTTDPTNSAARQSGATDSYSVMIVDGISVANVRTFGTIQSMNVTRKQVMAG